MNEKTITIKNTTPKERGQRLRYIREALRLSRSAFSEKHNIPMGSIQNWEDGRNGGLSEKGAQKMLKAFKAENIHCTQEWLWYGIGEPPIIANIAYKMLNDYAAHYEVSEDTAISQELILFHKHNKNAVDTIINDDALSPHFISGDLVAGKRYFAEEIQKAVGSICIIHLYTGEIIVRLLSASKKSNHYDLIVTNPQGKYSIHSDIKIFSAAPILWMRRRVTQNKLSD